MNRAKMHKDGAGGAAIKEMERSDTSPSIGKALLAFLMAWGLLWLVYAVPRITQSLWYYGEPSVFFYNVRWWLVPLAGMPITMALSVPITFLLHVAVLRQLTLGRLLPLLVIIGGCVSAAQFFGAMMAFNGSDITNGQNIAVLGTLSLIPGAAWGALYGWLLGQRQTKSAR
ncbi:hypothetical protein [Rhizobium sp. AG207R]|uniref:hypothetical protein n=1 Tax=Rhizobium sp. AG207R TaxID=2802287 RepID=UPI0022AC5756|nr:hypothetical protein [Rhizobium sp. AG207R]MCZ3377239.1 hypothetical protein [Rhizobium sp. AG207R]